MFDTARKNPESLSRARDDADRVVFFPFTPLIGYVLPRFLQYEMIVVRGLQRWLTLSFAIGLLALAIEMSLSLDYFLIEFLTLLVMLLLQYLTVRRLSRKMWKLPRLLAWKYYARWTEEKRLWQLLLLSLLLLPLLFAPNAPWYLYIIGLVAIYWLVSASSLLILRARLKRIDAQLRER